MWAFCDFVLAHEFVANARLLASSLVSMVWLVGGGDSFVSRMRFNFFAVWMAFESWLSGNVPVFSEFSVLCDWGDAVFLLFGDFEPAVGTFLAFGEFNLRHCVTLACVFVAHLAVDCFLGDNLNSLFVSDACLKFKLKFGLYIRWFWRNAHYENEILLTDRVAWVYWVAPHSYEPTTYATQDSIESNALAIAHYHIKCVHLPLWQLQRLHWPAMSMALRCRR